MAYLKLVMNHTQWGGSTNMSNAAHRWYVMHEIQEFLNGNHTATSDMNSTYINTAFINHNHDSITMGKTILIVILRVTR